MPAKKLIVVPGYLSCKNGELGANKVVLDKAVDLFNKFSKGKDEVYILLPAAISDDTRENKPLIFERQEAYLLDCMIPSTRILTSAKYIPSDTWTEVMVTHTICRDADHLKGECFEIHAIGFFPHSLKVAGCWRRIKSYFPEFFKKYCNKIRVYHRVGSAGSLKETIRVLVVCFASTINGLYDIRGEFRLARKIKERRRDEYTPKNLQHKVLF